MKGYTAKIRQGGLTVVQVDGATKNTKSLPLASKNQFGQG